MASTLKGYAVGLLDVSDGDIILVRAVCSDRLLVRDVLPERAPTGRTVKVVYLEGAHQGVSANVHIQWADAIVRFDEL
jgi:hypothetical protein